MDDEEDKKDTKFQPGVSGNPAGRPKGAKNKTSRKRFNDLVLDHVEAALTTLASLLGAEKDGDRHKASVAIIDLAQKHFDDELDLEKLELAREKAEQLKESVENNKNTGTVRKMMRT